MLMAAGVAWWLEFFKFIIAVIVAFLIPGSLLLPSKASRSLFVSSTLAILIGLVLWGWQEFIFGYFSLRNLTYLYLFLFVIIWLFKARKESLVSSFFKNLKLKTKVKQADLVLLFLVLLGVMIQVFPLWRNGVVFQEKGLLFTGGNIEDNLWHASLTNEITKRFPPHAPGLPGILMRNYHYWSNLVIAATIRFFKLPLFPTQFHFFPLFISLLLGAVTISFAKILNFNKQLIRLFVFFNYFGGDLIYLFLIILKRGPNFFSMSSLEDGSKFFYNPPRAFAFVIALSGLALFSLWQKKGETSYGLLSMFLLATTTGFKIYISLFFGLGMAILTMLAIFKKDWQKMFILLSYFLMAALIYLPTNSKAGGLIWAPFSIVNNFMVQPGLGLERLEEARIIFFEDKKYFKNLVFEIPFTLFFLTGIFGTKILGFFLSPFLVVKKLGKELTILLLAGIFLSTIVGIFFVQATGGANTFNFLVSTFLFTSILAAISVCYWQEKCPKFLSLFFIAWVILITIPRVSFETYLNFKNFLSPDGFFISKEELDLYEFLDRQTPADSKIVVDPDHYIGRNSPYLSVFIDRSLLVSGRGLLKHFDLNIKKEELAQDKIFKKTVESQLINQFVGNNIDYILLFGNHTLQATESAYFASIILKNKAGTVLEVDREALVKRQLILKSR